MGHDDVWRGVMSWLMASHVESSSRSGRSPLATRVSCSVAMATGSCEEEWAWLR